MSGLDALARIRRLHRFLPVILMTGQGTTETAIEATKRGAFDYQLKPFEPAEMLGVISKALESARLMKGRVALGPETAEPSAEAIVGRGPAMQQVYKAIGRVAESDITVLIRGESGTGKELVARAVYQHSLRSQTPLTVVNCAALPETLMESELFGYERGAFTGAVARRIGRFEQADGGTMFLDEVGDMAPATQAKVLRLLEERTFARLGGNETLRVDVRVLCATNRNLEKAISEGRFREDLYHRLNVVTIQIPPLRERREDIPSLVDYFLSRAARACGCERPPIAEDALASLVNYSWPGNVRELEHVIQQLVVLTGGYTVQEADLPQAVRSGVQDQVPGAVPGANLESRLHPAHAGTSTDPWHDLIHEYLASYRGERAHEELLERIERLLIAGALERSRGNQTRAAELLGLARPTLHAKIQKYGLRGWGDLPAR